MLNFDYKSCILTCPLWFSANISQISQRKWKHCVDHCEEDWCWRVIALDAIIGPPPRIKSVNHLRGNHLRGNHWSAPVINSVNHLRGNCLRGDHWSPRINSVDCLRGNHLRGDCQSSWDKQCWSPKRWLPQRWSLIPQDQQCWSPKRQLPQRQSLIDTPLQIFDFLIFNIRIVGRFCYFCPVL